MKPLSEIKPKLEQKSRKTERGELLTHFSQKLNMPIPRIAFHLTGFKLPDLYYIKSLCDSEEKRGTSWGKTFWGSIKTYG